jgi:hypothetical protein
MRSAWDNDRGSGLPKFPSITGSAGWVTFLYMELCSVQRSNISLRDRSVNETRSVMSLPVVKAREIFRSGASNVGFLLRQSERPSAIWTTRNSQHRTHAGTLSDWRHAGDPGSGSFRHVRLGRSGPA